MAERLTIEITGDAQGLVSTLNKSGAAVNDFAGKARAGTGSIGGLGSSLNSLAGSLIGPLSAVGGLMLLKDGLTFSVAAAKEAAAVNAQLDAVLKSTGGAAGMTASAVQELSAKMEGLTNFDDEAVTSGQNLLLTFTNIGSSVFPRATQSILDMSTALGQDVSASAMQLGRALNDPIAGVAALRRVGVQLSGEQQAMVASFMAVNDVASAQGVILAELEKEFGGSAAAAREADGGFIAFQNSLGNLAEVIGTNALPALQSLTTFAREGVDAWTAILQEGGLGDQVAQINAMAEESHNAGLALQTLEADLARMTDINFDGRFNDEIAALNKEIGVLKAQMDISGASAVSYSDDMRLAAIATGKSAEALRLEAAAAKIANAEIAKGAAAYSSRYAAMAVWSARADKAAAAQRGVERDRNERNDAMSTVGVLSFDQIEAAKTQAKGGGDIGAGIGRSMGQSITDTLRSAIESQIKPTLSEVWQPGGGGGDERHIDEWGRRAATIMTQGLNSEWITQLNSQFAGTDFWSPIQAAIEAGDVGGAQNLLGNLLTQNPQALWDKELIKQRVRDSMVQSGIKDDFINTIVAELQAEGLNVDLSQVTGAMGTGQDWLAADPGKAAAAMADPAAQTFSAFSAAFITVAGESTMMAQLGAVMATGAAMLDMKPTATALMTQLTTAIKEDPAFKNSFMAMVIQTLIGSGYVTTPRAGR